MAFLDKKNPLPNEYYISISEIISDHNQKLKKHIHILTLAMC